MGVYFLIGVASLLWIFYKWWTANYNYWKERDFPSLETSLPLGNLPHLVLATTFQGDVIKQAVDKMETPYAGVVLVRRPHLLLKDPEIIKQVMLKDFNHFTDRLHADFIRKPIDAHLFNLGGDKWRALRVKLTPIFTSGKLKLMFDLFEKCSKDLIDLLESQLESGKVCDFKEILGRFTADTISSCAFGLDISSCNNPNNQFIQVGQMIFPKKTSWDRIMKNLVNNMFPTIEKYFKFSLVPKKIDDFMTMIVENTFKHRRETKQKRNDFIDLLIELKDQGVLKTEGFNSEKGNLVEISLTEGDMVAQVFVFLAAGYETSSSVSTNCLYELALNDTIQNRLRNEINDVTKKHGGLTYQAVQEMQYLDQVVHETMRKYPTIPILSRKCTKTYRMPDRPDRVLDEGIRVLIPVYALHRDPKYFPEPDKFDPDRFSPENRASIPPFTYLPFGDGPRICIGMRFGLLQVKLAVSNIIMRYQLGRAASTPVPFTMVPSSLITVVKEPINLTIERVPATT